MVNVMIIGWSEEASEHSEPYAGVTRMACEDLKGRSPKYMKLALQKWQGLLSEEKSSLDFPFLYTEATGHILSSRGAAKGKMGQYCGETSFGAYLSAAPTNHVLLVTYSKRLDIYLSYFVPFSHMVSLILLLIEDEWYLCEPDKAKYTVG